MKELKFPDAKWAVFNLHVYDAGKRALDVCRHRFDAEDEDLKFLEESYRNGIMEIFHKAPTHPTRLFADSCYIFASGLDKESTTSSLKQAACTSET